MTHLFKHKLSPYWQFTDTRPGKANKQVSTKIRHTGKTPAETRDLLKGAEAFRREWLSGLRDERKLDARSVSFAEWAPQWLALKHGEESKRRGQAHERQRMPQLVGFFGEMLLHTIGEDQVDAYMKHRRKHPLVRTLRNGRRYQYPAPAYSTLNREIDQLKIMLEHARQAGKLIDPETGKAPKVTSLHGVKRRLYAGKARPVLSHDEVRRLLMPTAERPFGAFTSAVDRALYLMGYCTLAREGDLLDLQRRDVRQVTRNGRTELQILIKLPKNAVPLHLPAMPELQEALEAIWPAHGDDFFFAKFREAKNPLHWPGIIRTMFRRACARVDIPYSKTSTGEPAITWHRATRATGATHMLWAGKPTAAVQAIGGWRTEQQMYTYLGWQPPQIQDALNALSDVLRTPVLPENYRKLALVPKNTRKQA